VSWGYYYPGWVELTILLGSFAWFLMWFLIFIRIFPTISIHEVKELHYHAQHAGGHH
jgi:molybdopterin-containing oxidoreductase family membrane subunit